MKKKEKVLDYIMSYMACDNNPRTGYKRPKFKRFKKKKKEAGGWGLYMQWNKKETEKAHRK